MTIEQFMKRFDEKQLLQMINDGESMKSSGVLESSMLRNAACEYMNINHIGVEETPIPFAKMILFSAVSIFAQPEINRIRNEVREQVRWK